MASHEDILPVVLEILQRHVDGTRVVKLGDHIQNDLGFDSLGVMEIVADVEDRFEVTIPNDMLGAIATVEDVARVLAKLGAAA